ncbi:MAG: Hsp33 family molecular chaperone HslO [Desulfobulbaceae bacterium]|nr:Hsp33 family molecular chaperone HslO [Desulfobulbaceae bacterium]
MESPAEAGIASSFLLAEKTVRGVIIEGTSLVREMRNRHALGDLETLLLGQALLGTALMVSTLKGQDEINLRIDCSGPVKGLVVEATATGEVRGYLKQVPIPLATPLASLEGTNHLEPLWGEGFLTITRFMEEGRQPFSSSLALQSGNIAAEIATYYRISEQTPTAIHLSVSFDSRGELAGAGGLLLQAMPGADKKIFASLEQQTQALPSLGKALAEGHKIEPWLEEQLAPFLPVILEKKTILYRCRCDAERMRLLLLHLSLADLEDMRANGPFPVTLTCHFCNQHYPFEQQALADICREKQAQTATT